MAEQGRFLFPRWVNYLLPLVVLGAVGGGLYVPTLFLAGASPKATAVGYAPRQPVPYSHAVHAGRLGLDCRYCHTTVETAAFAALPPTQTCMNCHAMIKPNDGRNLTAVLESWKKGMPVKWVKVNDLPDYVYFDHSAHVTHGVGCVSCHDRVDRMDVVYQAKPLSMGWCLECHRAAEPYLRPVDAVTNMDWKPRGGQLELGAGLKAQYGIHDAAYMTSCYTCHR
jgi:menaquinone reductase, multiheme cytochrome c subunit